MSRSRVSRTILTSLGAALLTGCGVQGQSVPGCPGVSQNAAPLILMAQAVPSATLVPCIEGFPAGWRFGGEEIQTGLATFWLGSDRAGDRALTVTLARRCDTSRGVEVPPEADEIGTTRYEEPLALPPNYSGNRYYVFPGGCVTYRFEFGPGSSFALAVEATRALAFASRAEGVKALAAEGLTLCGATVNCPG